MIEEAKDLFAWLYKRFTWGYSFGGAGIQLFNFVGILTILFRGVSEEISRWILIPLFMFTGLVVCVSIGWLMFDKLKFKTKFAKEEGKRDDYWTHQLTPKEQKMMLLYLKAIENPKKLFELKEEIKQGKLI
jgi:hypothetical protein